MAPKNSHRRTVLKLVASLAVGSAALSTTGAGSSENAADPCTDVPPRNPGNSVDALASGTDTYVAVVDRIVNGRFVVLLLEEDDELVDQLVVPYDELPVDERDVLVVTVEDGEITEWRTLDGETRRRRKRAENRLDCLTR